MRKNKPVTITTIDNLISVVDAEIFESVSVQDRNSGVVIIMHHRPYHATVYSLTNEVFGALFAHLTEYRPLDERLAWVQYNLNWTGFRRAYYIDKFLEEN